MAPSDDVTPTAGRLLRPLGLPQSHRSLGLQRGPVSTSGRCSHGAASAAVHALHCSTEAPEAIAPISLELEAWPSEPFTPSTTTTGADSSEYDSTAPTTIPSLRRRYSLSPLGILRGHSRANSLDSTTTDSSVASSSSSVRSRWNILAPVLDELSASRHRPNYAGDKKSTGCAAIIFTGATYGAGLKTQQEWKDERQKFHGSPYDEQIGLLEGQRRRLVSERRNWERKLTALDERIREREPRKPES
ncbi:uncharacterized protein CTRU02_207628 [Colletotrichum truncatum]|uniref:Uncharacterized protein n=1 Tax=Colletotrichum truncatum TaxID=5467 RepID=A0ACC3Z1C9_COLTU|nr:uncharacterized protein CTRU02_09269 [Colletotrichum truncatum]KAF6788948.1 hypothetical protein CTRU02_09269 [Colletotrichum truncatum]